MESDPTVAQRFGRVLKRVTRQSGRLSNTSGVGSLILGNINEKPARRRVRIRVILTLIIPTVNMVGIGVMVLLRPSRFRSPALSPTCHQALHGGGAGLPPAVADHRNLVASHAHHQGVSGWSVEGRPPSRADQRNVFLIPGESPRPTWFCGGTGAILLTTLYGLEDRPFIPRLGLAFRSAGLVVATATIILFTESALRPVAARTGRRATAVPPGSGHHGPNHHHLVAGPGPAADRHRPGRAVLDADQNMTLHELKWPSHHRGPALVFGFCWSVHGVADGHPVRTVRPGRCDGSRRATSTSTSWCSTAPTSVNCNGVQLDGDRLARTGASARPVRQARRRDVAAAAEHNQQPVLGGEERHVAVMFVDVVGSTTLVATRPPMEVVNLLNRFFTVIVEEVDRHRGLLNKFEGDATLAVFKTPDHSGKTRGRGTGCRSDHLRSARPKCLNARPASGLPPGRWWRGTSAHENDSSTPSSGTGQRSGPAQ